MPLNLAESVQLKTHYSYHVTEGVRTHLFSETDTFVLNGNAFTVLIPMLAKNSMSINDIIGQTIDTLSPEYILYCLELLYEDDLITSSKIKHEPEDVFWSLNKSI